MSMKFDKQMNWKELPEGCLIDEPATSLHFKTGDWRSMRPLWSEEKCIQCLACWINCPDTAIVVEDGKMKGMNYDYCKGCGICAWVCPPKASAIEMVREEK
ncbi:4Fe-4S binding protein [bacterium]|nr:4Fe-4S binding protein [bacterium]